MSGVEVVEEEWMVSLEAAEEVIYGAAGWLPTVRKKRGQHRCGYWLEVAATTCIDDCVLVDYRSAEPGATPLVVWRCPRCEAPLKVWWPVDAWVDWMSR
jgi:hypothetical protein